MQKKYHKSIKFYYNNHLQVETQKEHKKKFFYINIESLLNLCSNIIIQND